MAQVIRQYKLTDAKRERLQPYFTEQQHGDKGQPMRELREILNCIFWISRSG